MQHSQNEDYHNRAVAEIHSIKKEAAVIRYQSPSCLTHQITKDKSPLSSSSSSTTDCCMTSKRRCDRRKRTVTFSSSMTMMTSHSVLAYIESIDDMTDDEMNARWFHPEELQETKARAVRLCQQIYQGSHKTSQNKIHSRDEDKEQESIRGMDVYFPGRQRHHKKFIQHVLEAYRVRCAGNEEHVSLLAEKWSCKSKERAIQNAIQDCYDVYGIPPVVASSSSVSCSRDQSVPSPFLPCSDRRPWTSYASSMESAATAAATSATSTTTTASSFSATTPALYVQIPMATTISSNLKRPAPPARTGSNNLVPLTPGRQL